MAQFRNNFMRFTALLTVLFAFLILSSCHLGTKKTQTEKVIDEVVNITFLQLNDVYEIAPLEGGKVGGLARVATIRQQLLKENPNTFTILAGDFLNPSIFGVVKHEGEKVKGKQMVATLNAMGLDLATFWKSRI